MVNDEQAGVADSAFVVVAYWYAAVFAVASTNVGYGDLCHGVVPSFTIGYFLSCMSFGTKGARLFL